MVESAMTYSMTKSSRLPFRATMGTESPRAEDGRMDERALVRGMLAGNERAFEEFSDAYIPALYRFASSRLNHDRELTCDIVQTTMVKAITKLATFRGEAALMTWLCACCKSEIAAHFRRGRKRSAEVEWTDDVEPSASPLRRNAPDGPEDSFLRDEVAGLVHAALDLLPPRYGQVLEWKYIDELPVKEIADRTKLRMKAAESLLTRARSSFRETFARLRNGTQS
jgi:RNA polymerase sigma-70 factor (ECF subfamily)